MNSSDEFGSENVLEANFIDCGVSDISTLHLGPDISSLNLHYNNIKVIKGLPHLPQLRHLDLSSNMLLRIGGLDRLETLRTLNLSCNRLKKVEGVTSLKQLVRLNVSYNEITDLGGLGELAHYPGHPLTVVDASHNQIRLVSHVSNTCQNLVNLRQLNLVENPLCRTPDYRPKMLKALPRLRILDGKDRDGKEIEVNILSDLPGLEHFMEYLSSSTDHFSEEIVQNHYVSKKRESVRRDNVCLGSVSEDHQDQKQDSSKTEMELKDRLQELEEKLSRFVTEKQDSSTSVAPKNSSEKSERRNKTFPEKVDAKEKTDFKVARLMKELDEERRKRLDLENKIQVLVTRYKELQLRIMNDRNGKEEAIKATDKLSAAFSMEKRRKEELEGRIAELEDHWNQKHGELLDCKKMLEMSCDDLRGKLKMREKELKDKSEEVTQLNSTLEEMRLRTQVAESNMVSVKKHCSNLEDQVDNLQVTLGRREKEYQMTLASRFSLDSKELQEYVQNQVKTVKEQNEREMRTMQERLNDGTSRYKALEDEFRVALHMEADRYEKLEKSYRQMASENNAHKSKVESLSKKDIESRALIEELTAVVKDQKTKLIELSKNKQEKTKESKERILTLEVHLEEARKQMIQFELTKQENKKLQAKQSAQESVIEGLKAERKLWSQELAQQGFLLTQDRSKLECKIESQVSDISKVKLELEKEVEASKNKSRMIEDQTATILRLKEGLLEKDQEAKSFSEKLLEDQKELENRVKCLVQENNHYKDLVSKLTARKEELKDFIGNLEEKLEESIASQELVNQKWKEKSELISKLESQVVQMKDYWEKKTDELTEERNESEGRYLAAKSELDSLEYKYKNQLEMAYKNKDFIKEEADERVAAVENEMRRLLMETNDEKKKLKGRLKILNRAIEEMETSDGRQ